MEGGSGEDGGFTGWVCSSIDGQGCHAVSLIEHGGGCGEYGGFGDAVSGERYLQLVNQVSIGRVPHRVTVVAALEKSCRVWVLRDVG